MNKEKIAYNCQKATFLIEKKQSDKITLKEQLELKYHLVGCTVCRLFEQQSELINSVVKKHFFEQTKVFKLSKEAKRTMTKQIEDQLKDSI